MIKLKNGAKIRPLTASQKTVRGPHPPFLLLDEIDEMDQAILDAALGQPMPQKNWRGRDHPAADHDVLHLAVPGQDLRRDVPASPGEELPIYTWCYRETSNPIDGWLDADFIEEKKRRDPCRDVAGGVRAR